MTAPAGATALYRIFDDENHLLYVGITCNVSQRFSGHHGDKFWWWLKDHHSVVWYRTRIDAKAAETAAIRDERPIFNKAEVDPKAWVKSWYAALRRMYPELLEVQKVMVDARLSETIQPDFCAETTWERVILPELRRVQCAPDRVGELSPVRDAIVAWADEREAFFERGLRPPRLHEPWVIEVIRENFFANVKCQPECACQIHPLAQMREVFR